MIRIVIENILLFLLPTLIYFAYVYVIQGDRRSARRIANEAPVIALFIAGTATVVIALALLGESTAGRPGQAYQPPVLKKDGRVEPGQIR